MWYEFLLEGLKKFAGEIIGVLLLVAFLYFFPNLRSLFTDYTLPGKEEHTEIQKERELHKQEEGSLKTEKSKLPPMSDEAFIELCKSGSVREVEEAILNGANVNAKDKDTDDGTALMWATVDGHTEMAELLLKYGANVNAKDDDGWTALMRASREGYTETAELLLKHGANVNARTNTGNTALFWASYEGYTETAELLLKHGANVNAKDNDGETALFWAEKNGHTETVNLLRKYGAK